MGQRKTTVWSFMQMQMPAFIAAVVLLIFPSPINTICSSSRDRRQPARSPQVRTEVKPPGMRSRPSTGKLLTVFQLNNATLRGHFVSHSDLGVYFASACSGQAQVWRAGGTTIMEHGRTSQQREIYVVKFGGHSFVYGTGPTGRMYKFPEHHNSSNFTEAEHEYRKRMSQGHASDEREVRQASEELLADPDSRLLANLSQALGEFGIYGHKSPCALPLYAMALSVARQHLQGEEEESLGTRSECENQPRGQSSSRERVRRAWWRAETNCTSLQEDPNGDSCQGMCGPGCSWCWDWLCGDCCYHQGCYEHDSCCRTQGFFSTSCLLHLLSVSCDAYSQYPGCLGSSHHQGVHDRSVENDFIVSDDVAPLDMTPS